MAGLLDPPRTLAIESALINCKRRRHKKKAPHWRGL